ncbi:MAG TPA: biopolymer transporter ExbD, partial [Anaeromyxobacteraceae bacterium]|nr:biopolymer transporter ExbD [Anaeromyxobacteraceae bacterium]
FLMADKTLPYGFVVEVMATVQRAGIVNVGMITDPRPDQVRPRREGEGER